MRQSSETRKHPPETPAGARVGETLPLFDEPSAEPPQARGGPPGADQHMQTAVDLARVLHRGGRRTRRAMRERTGIAICRHLATSLKLQAEREAQDRDRDATAHH